MKESAIVWLYRLNNLLMPVGKLYFRGSRAYGVENIPPRGPLLLACNHASFMDPWFIAMLFARSPIRYLINEEWYRKSPVWQFLFDAWGVVPAHARKPVETIRRVAQTALEGHIVAVFPEGKISFDGRVDRGNYGLGWIAALSGVPVIPCGLRGNFASLPRDKRWPRPGAIEIHIGRPRSFPGSPTPAPDPEAIRAFVAEVMTEICLLAGQPDRVPIACPAGRVADLRPRLLASPSDG